MGVATFVCCFVPQNEGVANRKPMCASLAFSFYLSIPSTRFHVYSTSFISFCSCHIPAFVCSFFHFGVVHRPQSKVCQMSRNEECRVFALSNAKYANGRRASPTHFDARGNPPKQDYIRRVSFFLFSFFFFPFQFLLRLIRIANCLGIMEAERNTLTLIVWVYPFVSAVVYHGLCYNVIIEP